MGKLSLQPEKPVKIWILRTSYKVQVKDLKIEALVCKFVFTAYFVRSTSTNKDGSTGEAYLVSNNLELSADQFTCASRSASKALYKKRWGVEEYHKSLKQNASLAKSPTRRVKTQTAHLFASLLAYVKLERLKFVHKMNHFAMKTKIYVAALRHAWMELENMKNYQPCVT